MAETPDVRHTSTWTEDEDEWIVIVCSCGATSPGLPDAETAADVWGDHIYEVTSRWYAAEIVRLRSLLADAEGALERVTRFIPDWATSTNDRIDGILDRLAEARGVPSDG